MCGVGVEKLLVQVTSDPQEDRFLCVLSHNHSRTPFPLLFSSFLLSSNVETILDSVSLQMLGG